jgi:glycerol-3-phosphate dehydrogenase
VRPTLYAYGPNEDKLSRDHRIVDHAEHGAPGLYSMIGGKLASYRLFAEEMVDVLGRQLGVRTPCASHITPLPGGDEPIDAAALARQLGIDEVAARRLRFRHGSRARRVAERVGRRPEEARRICTCEPVIEAEVRYVLRHEHARTVGDVARRTRLGLGPCGGMRCACRAGLLVADELGLEPAEGKRQALRFLTEQARTRTVALGTEQARQEALGIAQLRAQLGLREEGAQGV